MGGVYGVGAGGYLSRRPRQERTFSIQFGCAPDAVDKLVKASFDEAAVFAKTGIGADYLEKTKAAFLRDRETQLKTNGFTWSSAGFLCMIAMGMLKLYVWMQIDKNDILREMKRLELQLATLMSRADK
jgi:hypothetical protein